MPANNASSWENSLRQGSFRGIVFSTQSSDTSQGRRAVLYDLPYQERWLLDDIGISATTYALNVFVAGSDYMSRRNDLLKALSAPGA